MLKEYFKTENISHAKLHLMMKMLMAKNIHAHKKVLKAFNVNYLLKFCQTIRFQLFETIYVFKIPPLDIYFIRDKVLR